MNVAKNALILMIVVLIVCGPLAGCSRAESVSSTIKANPTSTGINGKRNSGNLRWSDEFNGKADALPDPNKWAPNVGGKGWGNEQLEYNTDNQNVFQDGHGNLVLEARKSNPERLQCWYGLCQYTSARITTAKRFSFTYGRLEARIKAPKGQGLWPAFWVLGSNVSEVGWPASGEIDIMELKGHQPSINYGVVHGPGKLSEDEALNGRFQQTYQLPQGTYADDFHIFALEWSQDALRFFVDDANYATLNKASLANQQAWVFDHPFDIVLNVAVGGRFPGNPDATTIFPQKMQIDYVRLYDI